MHDIIDNTLEHADPKKSFNEAKLLLLFYYCELLCETLYRV